MTATASSSALELFCSVRTAYERRDYTLCRSELAKIESAASGEPEFHRWFARLAYREGQWAAVKENASAYLENFPDDREMVQLHARACSNLKQWREASSAWEHLTELRPEWPEGWYQLARSHAKAGQVTGSNTAARKLAAFGGPESHALAARFFVETDRIAQAIEFYSKLPVANLESELAESRGTLRGTAAILAALQESCRSPELAERSRLTCEELMRRAIPAERSGRLDQACADYSAALLLASGDELARRSLLRVVQKLHLIAQSHVRQRNFEDALRAWASILRCAPKDPQAASRQARLLVQLRRWEEAGEAWRAVCEILPLDIDARVQLARAVERARSFELAEDAWRSVLQIDPANAEAQKALAHLLARMIREARLAIAGKRLIDAFEVLTRVPTQCAERQDADQRLAALARHLRKDMRAAYKQMQYSRVVRSSAAAMQLLPDDAEIHKLIAKAATRTSAHLLATKAWRRLIDLDPSTDLSHYLELAKACLNSASYDDALSAVATVLTRDPDNRRAQNLRLEIREIMLARN